MTPQPRKQYRPKTGGRWRAVNPDRPPVFSEVSQVRIHPDDMGLVREQTARYWIWTRLDDYPAPGYTTSVHVSEEEGGWVITDLVRISVPCASSGRLHGRGRSLAVQWHHHKRSE